MTKLGLLSTSALRSAICLSAAVALVSPAMAQDAAANANAPEALKAEVEVESGQNADSAGEAIVVTGSRIRRPNLDSALPVTSIGGEDFLQQGQTNVGDTLNDLPQLRSTFAQQNPGLGIGIAGLNLLDLRGLGTQRTLTLVNGRRHVAADILNNGVSPDVNTIPNDLIERVDVVTGGNSAIYGSDAIAGVVNFILRRNFEGFQIRGNAAISEAGFGGNQYVSGMYGMNFADGRGNITIHGEYAHQERVYGSDIPWYRSVDGLSVTDVDPAGLPNGSDGIPDRTFIRDIRSASIHRYGLVPIVQPIGAGAQCGTGIPSGTGASLPYNCTYIFRSDGTLAPQTGSRFGQGIVGGITGGNGQTGREDKLLSVLPMTERYNANLLAHYTFSDALEAFVEAKYVRVNTEGSNFGPSGITGSGTQFDTRERIRLDNPFLNPAARATIAGAILASGCNTSFTVACNATGGALTDAQRAAIADGSYRFVIGRSLLDVDARDERFERDTYRIVGGLRGTFNDDWSYEISANYGRLEEHTTTQGYVDKQRFMLAMDSGRNPVTGQIQCRAQFDPAAAVAFPNSAGNRARLAADIAACVPYNPFGVADNSAARSYFARGYTNDGWSDQLVFSGYVSGDTSQLFELPGGPVRFALGAEYRQEQAYYSQDDFAASGNSTAVAFGTFDPPSFKVKEAFAEIQIPILRDMPLFEELTISGAGRVADYQGATGTVIAYNGGVEWSPVRDVRFRANYGRSIRAPNSSETYGELIPNFAPNFQDPCRPANIGAGSQYRGPNCQADLGALLPNLDTLGIQSLPVLSGVNPSLREETSTSLTIGAVIQPRMVPGLSLSVDYYDITVNDVITSVTAQQVANGCYDAPTLDNPFCALFQRFRGPGTGPLGENPGQIQGNTLIQAPLNYAKRVRRGVDVEAAYRTNIGEDLRLDTRLIYSHGLQNSNYQNPTDPEFENRLLGEVGDPVDEARWDVALTRDAFTIAYQMRYIGSMWVNAYEDFNSLQGRTPQDADFADIQKFPAVFYHDLRFDWAVNESDGGKNLNFFVGVENLFDKKPPLGSTATGAGPGGTGSAAIYNIRGRNYFAGFKARF